MSHNENLFKGSIGRTYQNSQPWWPDELPAPKGAPNIVIIVLDDVGFADLGCYGSEIATPCMDRLARGGVRYSNFHVTSMCSPTRACLFTGRNAHAVGMGFLPNGQADAVDRPARGQVVARRRNADQTVGRASAHPHHSAEQSAQDGRVGVEPSGPTAAHTRGGEYASLDDGPGQARTWLYGIALVRRAVAGQGETLFGQPCDRFASHLDDCAASEPGSKRRCAPAARLRVSHGLQPRRDRCVALGGA
jgi:Sulfatase